MEESTQQLLALLLVAAAVGLELLRRYRKKRAGKAGCDGCETSTSTKSNAAGESTIRFYRKNS